MLYPNNIKKKVKKNISFANRGMDLETLINEANNYYLNEDIAVIYKKPTPVKIKKVTYTNDIPKVEGYLNQKSTLDYVGLYKGKYIDFDAKEVKNSSSFALSNLHAHQLKHLKRVKEHGGISFLIVRFYKNNITYLIEIDEIIDYINSENRKSIPIDYFEPNAHRIPDAYIPRVNYIKVIDNLYFK